MLESRKGCVPFGVWLLPLGPLPLFVLPFVLLRRRILPLPLYAIASTSVTATALGAGESA